MLTNDIGATLASTALLVSQPAHGSVALNADGSFTYTPATPLFTTDTFTYRYQTGNTASPAATVTIENLAAPEIALTKFYSDGTDFKIQYAVLGANVGSFSIGIYASIDGETLGEELEIAAGNNAQGLHTLTIAPTFIDLEYDYYLLA